MENSNPSIPKPTKAILHRFSTFILAPLAVYFIFFCVLTYPLIAHFATDCYCDTGDGYVASWRLWWIDKAVTELHQSPWETNYLYYPVGLHLIVDDFSPFNGFVGVVFNKFVPLSQVYNLLVIVGFVLSGFFTFWLAFYLTRSYSGSLIAGFIFTFSNYHFAHLAMGHLPTLTMYGIPLFVLFWFRFMDAPTLRRAIYPALALGMVTLTHLYFLFYCILIGMLIAVGHLVRQKDVFLFFRRQYLRPTLVFITLTLLVVGPYIGVFLALNQRDPVIVDPFGTVDSAGHLAKDYSVDVFALFLPAGRTGTAILSRAAGTSVKYTYAEHNAYPGWLVWGFILLMLIQWRRFSRKVSSLWLWYVMLLFFILLSFGPVLHFAGREIPAVPMLYTLLEKAVPLFGSSGTPGRVIAMSLLCASIITAYGIKIVFLQYADRPRAMIAITAVLLAFLTLEYLPLPLPVTPPDQPPYVQILRDQPGFGGLIDDITPAASAMHYQTIHEKPLAFSYTARVTKSAGALAQKLKTLLQGQQYETLCNDYNYQYLITSPSIDVIRHMPSARVLYHDSERVLYKLGCNLSRSQEVF